MYAENFRETFCKKLLSPETSFTCHLQEKDPITENTNFAWNILQMF